jgi:predicted nucleic acid-binding protein
MFGLDTSVVLRLLVGAPEEQTAAARRFLEESREPLLVSDLVIAESYHALRHHYDVPHAAAVDFLIHLTGNPRIRATGNARQVLADARGRESLGLVHRLIHAAYRTGGADLLTFDRGAARLNRARLLR